jgi:hypothetical protein
MPRLGFEPTIPVFERAKTFYALDRAAAVIGMLTYQCVLILCYSNSMPIYMYYSNITIRYKGYAALSLCGLNL